jgi:hypothetical protein
LEAAASEVIVGDSTVAPQAVFDLAGTGRDADVRREMLDLLVRWTFDDAIRS